MGGTHQGGKILRYIDCSLTYDALRKDTKLATALGNGSNHSSEPIQMETSS